MVCSSFFHKPHLLSFDNQSKISPDYHKHSCPIALNVSNLSSLLHLEHHRVIEEAEYKHTHLFNPYLLYNHYHNKNFASK